MADNNSPAYVITAACIQCGMRGMVEVTIGQWNDYQNMAKVQDAFPQLSPGLRQQIMDGIHPECFDIIVAENEESSDQIELLVHLGRVPRSLAVRITNCMRREGYTSLVKAWDEIGPEGIIEWRNIGKGALSVIARTVRAEKERSGMDGAA